MLAGTFSEPTEPNQHIGQYELKYTKKEAECIHGYTHAHMNTTRTHAHTCAHMHTHAHMNTPAREPNHRAFTPAPLCPDAASSSGREDSCPMSFRAIHQSLMSDNDSSGRSLLISALNFSTKRRTGLLIITGCSTPPNVWRSTCPADSNIAHVRSPFFCQFPLALPPPALFQARAGSKLSRPSTRSNPSFLSSDHSPVWGALMSVAWSFSR